MPGQSEIPPEVYKGLPGAIGAIVALRWIVGSPVQRATAVVGGTAASYYGSPWLALWAGFDHGLAGFLVGLFGMAVVAKIFDALALLDLQRIIDKLLGRLGL